MITDRQADGRTDGRTDSDREATEPNAFTMEQQQNRICKRSIRLFRWLLSASQRFVIS